MLDRLLIRLVGLAFACVGLVMVNDQVLDGALCIGAEGDRVVITDGCLLHDQVDLSTTNEDLFGDVLDGGHRPSPATVRSHLP